MKPVHLVAGIALLAGCSPEPAGAPAPSPVSAGNSTAAARASSCPGNDFESFLRAFSADAAIRKAYTAPYVRVTDWVDVDETERGTETKRVPRDGYDGFRLRHRGDRYLHVEFDDMGQAIPVRPKITPRPDGYYVEYAFNMSEGNSWTFARADGCWQLVADPEPSLL